MKSNEPKDFLNDVILDWTKQFEGISLNYYYDSDVQYHVIEVGPESIRRGNKVYKETEMKLWTDFSKKFPDSNLLIKNFD